MGIERPRHRDSITMEELAELDAAGYRVVRSLWPGDQFLYRGEYHTVKKVQPVLGSDGLVYVRTEGTGPDFQFDQWLLFPSIITDEHFQAEGGAAARGDQGTWW
jgi:hypothetical protein